MAYCVYSSVDSGALTHFIALATAPGTPTDPAMFLTVTVMGSGPPPTLTLTCGTGSTSPVYSQGATTFSFDGKNVDITYADAPVTPAPSPASKRYQIRFVLDPGTTLEMINRTVWSISFAGIGGQSFSFVVADNEDESYSDVAAPLVDARNALVQRQLRVKGDAAFDAKIFLQGLDLRALVEAMQPPIGSIFAFAGTKVPDGYLLCDGQSVDQRTYRELFNVLGDTWGKASSPTTFKLPDLRGRAAIGSGQGAGLTARQLAQTLGQETHALTTAELPSHSHGGNTGSAGDHSHSASVVPAGGHSHGGQTAGGGDHNHTGRTGGANAIFYRVVDVHNRDPNGKNIAANHVTGWAGGGFTDHTDANFPVAGHTHDFATNQAGGHAHGISADGVHGHNASIATQGAHAHPFQTDGGTGGGQAHGNMQPSAVVHYIIKAQSGRALLQRVASLPLDGL